MTLPFRRRHHDDEAWHDRARALFSAGFLGPLDADDQAWLARHLERCSECRAEREAYDADRAMLRSLRDQPVLPPRDLWARTAAELERQGPAARGRRGPLGLSLRPVSSRGLPYGPLAGALVALVVLVVAFLPPGTPQVAGPSPLGSQVAAATQSPGPTPIQLAAADRVAWVTSTGDGHFSIVFAPVDEVCTAQSQGCAPLAAGSPAPLQLGAPPQAVLLSPLNDQVAVVGAEGETAGSVVMVSIASPRPTGSLSPTPVIVTPSPTAVVRPSASPVAPTESAGGTPAASPTVVPAGAGHAIIHDVTVIGDAGYSADGQWFAFSARPLLGLGGPDLYVWHVGDDAATQLTHDGATYFSGWFQDRIVASGIVFRSIVEPDASPGADVSAAPSAPAAPSGAPPSSPGAAPSTSPVGEEHPYSFLIDPVSGERTTFAQPDVWLPAIDPTGRFVAYWSGTVEPAEAPVGPVDLGRVTSWRPATGRLVLDGWNAPLASPAASGEPAGSGEPSLEPTIVPATPPAPVFSEAPGASPGDGSPEPSQPAVAAGPAGTPILLAEGPLTDFDARFDPTGTRLAIWTADPDDAKIGPLWLVLLDPLTGAADPTDQPLEAPGVVALRGFSLQDGRLGWITPPGQDGQPSSVHVLGWSGAEFGEVQTVPGGSLQIVR